VRRAAALFRAIQQARLHRSARLLHELAAAAETGAYSAKDTSLLEVRRVTPAIVARFFDPRRVTPLSMATHKVPSNLALVAGLIASQTPSLAPDVRFRAIAAAVRSIQMRWLLPRRSVALLLTACEGAEWGGVAADIALATLQRAFRIRRSMALWRRLLGELARQERWADLCAELRSRRLLAWRARRVLGGRPDPGDRDAVQAGELIAMARCRIGATDRSLARCWLLPLIGRSTDRYLTRTQCARRLSEQLVRPAHVKARELAEAIERGVAPLSPDNYSNFREAFCPETWELLHPAFRDAGIFTELEVFASEDDRCRFWRHIAPKGGPIR
jgi:hypothetical protein